MRFASILTALMAVAAISSVSATGAGQPASSPVPQSSSAQIPVTGDLEPSEPGAGLQMAPVNRACDSVPFSPNHKRWAVKSNVLPKLMQPNTLAQALSKTYTAAQLIQAKNLPFTTAVPPDRLDLTDTVKIGNDVHHEGDAIAVHGVVLALGCETDGDIHIDLSTSTTSHDCAVVEVANPADLDRNIPRSSAAFVANMEKPLRRRFAEIYNQGSPQHATPRNPAFEMTVVGQLYYDTDHLQRNNPGGGRGLQFNHVGCARNLWEVHPILSIKEGP